MLKLGSGVLITCLIHLSFFTIVTVLPHSGAGFHNLQANDHQSSNEYNIQGTGNSSGNLVFRFHSSGHKVRNNQNSTTSILQAYLFLLSHTVFKKYRLTDEVCGKISEGENIGEHSLFNDIQTDITNFDKLLDLFRQSKHFDEGVAEESLIICADFFHYTMSYTEYIFERKLMAKKYFYFQHSLLSSRLNKFNHTVLVNIIKTIEVDCGSVLFSSMLIPSVEHLYKINDFFLQLIEINLVDNLNFNGLVKKHNDLLLWFAVDGLKRFDHLTALGYLTSTTSEDYLSDIIEEVCYKNCSLLDFFSLNVFVLRIVSQPMVPDSFKAEYFSKLESKAPFNSSHALVLETVIRMLLYDDAHQKNISNLLENSSNSSNNFLHNLAETIAKTDVDEITEAKELFLQYLTLPLFQLNSNRTLVYNLCVKRYITHLVRHTYMFYPDEVDSLCEFIKTFAFPENIFVAYDNLLEVILEFAGEGIYYPSGLFKLAYHLKQEPNQEFFAPLKSKLPQIVRDLMWNYKKCLLKNVAYNLYLYISDMYFVNNFGNDKEDDNRQFAVVSGGTKSSVKNSHKSKYQWEFIYNKKNNAFFIQSAFFNSYLHLGKRLGLDVFRLETLKQILDENSITQWTLQLVLNSTDYTLEDYFMVRVPGNGQPTILYVCASRDGLDNSTRNVAVSNVDRCRVKGKTSSAFWTLDCEERDRLDMVYYSAVEMSNDTDEIYKDEIDKFIKKLPFLIPSQSTDDYSDLYSINEVRIINFFKKLNFISLVKNTLNFETLTTVYERLYYFGWAHVFKLVGLLRYSSWPEGFRSFVVESLTAFNSEIFTLHKHLYEINKKEHFAKYLPANVDLACDATLAHVHEIILYMNISHKVSHLARAGFVQEDYDVIERMENRQKGDYLMAVETFIDFFGNVNSGNQQYAGVNNCSIRFASLKRNTNFFDTYDLQEKKTDILYTLTIDAFHDLSDSKEIAAIFFLLLKDEKLISNMFYNVLNRATKVEIETFNKILTFIYFLYDNRLLSLKKTSEIFVDSYDELFNRFNYMGPLMNMYRYYVSSILHNILKINQTSFEEARLKLQELQFKIENKTDKTITALIATLISPSSLELDGLIPLMTRVLTFVSLEKTLHTMYIQDRRHISLYLILFFLERLHSQDVRFRGYDVLVEEMLLNPKENVSEIYNLARFVHKFYGYIPCFHSGCVERLDVILPFYTKGHVVGKRCTIFNMKFGKYLYISGPYFVNDFKRIGGENFVYTVTMGNGSTDTDHSSFMWTFEYVEENDTFLLRSNKNYLSAGVPFNRNFGDYRLKFDQNKYIKYPSEWRVELFPNDDFQNDVFRFSPLDINMEEKLYFLSAHGVSDGSFISVSKLETSADRMGAVWRVECDRIQ